MKKTTAHIISHTHWDREWYMPYEKHHFYLVKLMDSLLDLLQKDPEYKSFHLDGQTIILEDYLQVRPEMKPILDRFIREGRLHIGPWYVLQDEFLTSSEANLRNLLLGHEQASEYGVICHAGYLPDSFGNMGQAPQIFKQAHIDSAIFGRGVRATGKANADQSLESYMSHYSEMFWESPDGSRVIGILFANWYHNGWEIPTDKKGSLEYWQQHLQDVEKYASTSELLFMNGCDHQPVQLDLSEALRTARELYPDIEFVHSNFDHYIQEIKKSIPSNLAVIQGELRNQRTHGLDSLVNTASSRIYLKQWNQKCQTALEKVAEPLAVMLYPQSGSYPHDHLRYAWKTLMQNHPHDSICGCSLDEVHREMETRFEKSYHYTQTIIEESKRHLAEQINTTCFEKYQGRVVPFVVVNTTGDDRSAVVSIELELDRGVLGYDRRKQLIDELEQLSIGLGAIVDASGNPVDATIEHLGVKYGLALPERTFRIPYFARTIRVTFQAEHMSGLSYQTYAWVEQSILTSSSSQEKMTAKNTTISHSHSKPTLENEHLKVLIHENGTLEITHKASNTTYKDALLFEDVGDLGNGYMFFQPKGEKPLTTLQQKAEITFIEQQSYRTVYEIKLNWQLPVSANDTLLAEQLKIVPIWDREAQRAIQTVSIAMTTQVILEKNSTMVKFKTTLHNHAKDHRIRVCFPTDIETTVHYADSIFEIPMRQNTPHAVWENPSHCQHQQAFVNVRNDSYGLTIANQGLPEYEILRDGRNTIAVTLLRAVGELGDFGYFPTPEGQCQGEYTFEYAFIPHGKSLGEIEDTYKVAYQYQVPMTTQQTTLHTGSVTPCHQFFNWSGEHLAMTAVKMNATTHGYVYRWFNMSTQPTTLRVESMHTNGKWYRSNVLEEKLELIPLYETNQLKVDIRPAEIVTLLQIVEN